MSFFISDAMAEGADAAAQPDPMIQMLFFIGIFVLFYFLLIRPQAKRAKEHRKLVSELSKGDEVVTSGGIVGKITSLTDEFATLEVAAGMEVHMQRSSVNAVLPKGTIKSL